MIISLHMPKTGGTSFLELLSGHFKGAFMKDYGDRPMSMPVGERILKAKKARVKNSIYGQFLLRYQGIQCIHGHFLPYKYQCFLKEQDVAFVTWLRDPFERFTSHYHYWRRTYSKQAVNPFHIKMVEENWSFDDFCFSPHFQNFYASFLWNFPIENFDFIGISEYYESEITWFANHFLKENLIEIAHRNVNPEKKNMVSPDERWLEKFKKFHALDYAIYEYALRKRLERCNAERLPSA